MASGDGRKAVRIAIFSHKGGVGKTTLTVNVAYALESLGKRVLLVDSDPQCNLTAYLVEEPVVDDLLDSSDTAFGGTLWSAVKPVAEGTGDIRIIPAIERSSNIFLLPGDIQLSQYEQELGPMWNDCFQRKTKGFRGTTALSQLVQTVSVKHEIDFVFYDAGPNIGPLNRVLLLDCDYFIVPAACDLFSIRALKTLGYALTNWINDWKMILELAPIASHLLTGMPRFMGYVPQRFRVYGGSVSSDYSKYLPRLEKQIGSDVVTVLRRMSPDLVPEHPGSHELGQVKDFGSIAAASQAQGVPIKDVHAGTPEQRNEARETFLSIAKSILVRANGKT